MVFNYFTKLRSIVICNYYYCYYFGILVIADDEEPLQCYDIMEYNAMIKGEIKSPLYDKGQYPDNLYCEYKITAPQGYVSRNIDMDFNLTHHHHTSKQNLNCFHIKNTITEKYHSLKSFIFSC